MVEEVFPGLYRIEVPLLNNPLRSINSYVIKAPGRSLVIDSGLILPECFQAWKMGIDDIGLHQEDVDFFLTHMHSDHIALATEVASEDTKLYIGEYDEPSAARILESTQDANFWPPKQNYQARNGFPREQLEDIIEHLPREEGIKRLPGFSTNPPLQLCFTALRDGASIDVGDFHFTCIWTPGHSKGHLCLYEPQKKILFSGDHILGIVTQLIPGINDDVDVLGDFLESLTKIERLDVELTLPGHRRVIRDTNGRINKLRRYHQRRLVEVMDLLLTKDQTAYEVASGMLWNISPIDWDETPIAQRWFETDEAISYLRYLNNHGMARSYDRDGLTIYSAIG